MDYKTEVEFKTWIESHNCDLNEYLEDIKIINTGSASESIFLSAKIMYKGFTKNVFIKILLNPNNPLNNCRHVERQIYANITTLLVNNHHTPCLLNYIYSTDECSLPLKISDDDTVQELLDNVQSRHVSLNSDLNKIGIIITETTQQTTLYQYLKTSHTNSELFVVFFLIFWTLKCFENLYLTHNDLHSKNIFIDTVKFYSFNFTLNSKSYTIFTNLLPRIYDFDRSSIYHLSVERNLFLDFDDYCDDFSQCNYPNPQQDVSAVIAEMLRNVNAIGTVLKDWLTESVSGNTITDIRNRKYLQIFSDRKKRYRYVTDSSEIKNCNSKKEMCIREDILESLLNLGLKNKFIIELKVRSTDIVHSLPNKSVLFIEHPISKASHPAEVLPQQTNTIDSKDIDDLISKFKRNHTVFNNNLIFKSWTDEFDYLESNYKILLSEFVKKHDISNNHEYIAGCILLCIPFCESLDIYSKKALIKKIFNIDPNIIFKAIDTIWNYFRGKLPIKQMIL